MYKQSQADNNRRVAVITGGSSGIGAAIAKHLARQGIVTVLTYRINVIGGQQVYQEIYESGGTAILRQLDVTDQLSVQELAAELHSKFGKLDILINNAGADRPTPIETCSLEDWQYVTGPKIDGNFLCTKYFLPMLKNSTNANLVIISSSLAINFDIEDPAYSVGAAAALVFGQVMSRSLAKYRIRTNIIAPGSIPTNLEYWRTHPNPDLWSTIAESNPLGRRCSMDDITHVLDFIIDEHSDFVNGNVFYITGGVHVKLAD